MSWLLQNLTRDQAPTRPSEWGRRAHPMAFAVAKVVSVFWLGASCRNPTSDSTAEQVRRDAYALQVAQAAGLADAWSLCSRHNVHIAEGFTGVQLSPLWHGAAAGKPSRIETEPAPARLMEVRSHIRVRAMYARPYELALRGRLDLRKAVTLPRLEVVIDGLVIGSALADATGAFELSVPVAYSLVREWTDVYFVFTSVGQPERDAADARMARLERLLWRPL